MVNMGLVKKLLVIVTSGIIGVCVGLTYAKESMMGAKNYHILYVAEDELMELENERVKADDLGDRELFFGDIEKAVNLATSLPKTYQNASTRVVYSMSAVRGENVRSISSEIHKKIIENLTKTRGVSK